MGKHVLHTQLKYSNSSSFNNTVISEICIAIFHLKVINQQFQELLRENMNSLFLFIRSTALQLIKLQMVICGPKR